MSVRLSSAERQSSSPRERLGARRRRSRRQAPFILGILVLLLGAGLVYELNQSALRISHIQMYGVDQSYADIATLAMQGNYLGLIPRDSTIFYPGSQIRSDIIAQHPDIAAVSIFRNGFTGLSIKINNRVPVARWCGAIFNSTTSDLVDPCYLFDASGFVFATSSALQPINAFRVYEPLTSGVSDPLTTTLPNALKLPSTFEFARQLATLGTQVTSVVIRDDEVDDYLVDGTRVTYLLGHERDAFTALVSAHDTDMNLADGSLEYVDLRFSGKIYLKKKVSKP